MVSSAALTWPAFHLRDRQSRAGHIVRDAIGSSAAIDTRKHRSNTLRTCNRSHVRIVHIGVRIVHKYMVNLCALYTINEAVASRVVRIVHRPGRTVPTNCPHFTVVNTPQTVPI